MRCQIVFNTWESKAFIAKAIISHSGLKKALEDGVVAIGRGITNAFILREILEVTENSDFQVDYNNYVAGVIDGSLWISHSDTRTPEVAFYKGKPKFEPMNQAIENATLVIKGANALGPDWIAGVLCAHPTGGTIGSVYATAISRGIKIIIPISIEKMIPFSVTDIAPDLGGQQSIDYVSGLPVGLFPVIGGEIFSEIEAIEKIANVEVYPIGAGGVYDGAGATIFEISGTKEEVEKVIDLYERIKNTKPLDINLKPH
ncbi:MAG: hypothetical protein ACXADY_07245 [Candidatus Hodarchaeales archaeon]|jgi:hypothetical protein